MNIEDHIWNLTVKKAAGEASVDEVTELEELLKQNPQIKNKLSILFNWVNDDIEHQNTNETLDVLFGINKETINAEKLPDLNLIKSKIDKRLGLQKNKTTNTRKKPHAGYFTNYTAMIKNYLKIALRQMMKQKMYSAIKVGGFALSISACLLITLYIRNELSFDKSYPDTDRIYRLVGEFRDNGTIDKGTDFPSPMAKVLKADYPEIEKSGRLMPNTLFWGAGANELRPADATENTHEEGFAYADQSLLDILKISMIYGDAAHALSEPMTMVISKTKADKFFPGQNPVGKVMYLNNDKTKPYKIAGVMPDFPKTSHLNYSYLLTLSGKELWHGEQTTWLASNYSNYVLLKQGTNIAQFEKKITEGILKKYVIPVMIENGNKMAGTIMEKSFLHLQPIADINLKSYDIHDNLSHGDIRFIWLFGAVAGFILIIACINFINLSTAKSANRAKEVGLRKVVGSQRSGLIAQFLTESLLFSFLSFVLGIVLAGVLLPYFNVLASKSLVMPWHEWWLVPAMLTSAIIVGVAAGIYPAFYLSGFRPVDVLKGKLSGGSKSSTLRNGLVVFQFTTSIVLIISTLVIYNQMQFILNKKVGFEKDQVIMIQGANTLDNEVKSFKNELLKIPAVASVSISDFLPVNGTKRNGNTFYNEGKTREETGISGQYWGIDNDYIKTMGIKLVAGRNFNPDMKTDSQSVIINQTLAKKLNLKNPVGKKVQDGNGIYPVIGVVQDFNFESLRDNIGGLVMHMDYSPSIVSVKVRTADMKNALAQITATWKSFSPNQPIRYTFMDEQFANMYADVQRMGRIFTSFATLAVIVACLGLFALAAFMAEQRGKEIGIRKVLGASTFNITRLLSFDFIKLVFIAIIIASPIAWWAMNKWLQDFSYRAPISWIIFAVAGISAIGIALFTVSFQAIKAAIANPIDSLRSE